MSKTSMALRRLGVAGLSAVTIGAGMTALGATAVTAATAPPVTGVSITPTSTATAAGTTTADCQKYIVQASDTNAGNDIPPTGSTIKVIITPAGGTSTQTATFCGPNVPANGTTSGTASFQNSFTTDPNGQVTFGVEGSAAGQIGIRAFFDTSGNNFFETGEPSDTATQTVVPTSTVAANSASDAVNKLTAIPANVFANETNTATPNPSTFLVTATDGGALVAGATVNYQITDSENNVVGAMSNSCGTTSSAALAAGVVVCNINTPLETANGVNGGSTGPFTVTFFVPQSAETGLGATGPAGTEPTAKSTITALTPPPAGSVIGVTCGTSSTNRNGSGVCSARPSTASQTITATVRTGDGSTSTAVGSTAVDFAITGSNGNGSAGFTPQLEGSELMYTAADGSIGTATLSDISCKTGTDGTCSVTLSLSATPFSGFTVFVTGNSTDATDTNIAATTVDNGSGNGNNVASVTFTNANTFGPATNVTISHGDSAKAGGVVQVTATALNSAGTPTNNNSTLDPITFTVSGGTFTDGSQQVTVNASDTGKAVAAVTRGSAGTATVTATLNTADTDCADADGGNCSASTTVTFTSSGSSSSGKTTVHAKLEVSSGHRGKLHVHLTSNHPDGKVRVSTISNGDRHTVGYGHTGSGGSYSETFKKKAGKRIHVEVKIYSSKHFKSYTSSVKSVRIKG